MENNNEIKIVNLKQVEKYAKHGLQPLRIEVGYNNKLVFIYDRTDELKELFHKWLDFKLD